MADFKELREQAKLGDDAQTLLDNKMLWRTIKKIRTNILEKFDKLPYYDADEVKNLKIQLIALQAIEKQLKTWANSGKKARHDLDKLNQNG